MAKRPLLVWVACAVCMCAGARMFASAEGDAAKSVGRSVGVVSSVPTLGGSMRLPGDLAATSRLGPRPAQPPTASRSPLCGETDPSADPWLCVSCHGNPVTVDYSYARLSPTFVNGGATPAREDRAVPPSRTAGGDLARAASGEPAQDVRGDECATCHLAEMGIAGSPHDFTGQQWSRGGPCTACHQGHEGIPGSSAAPWNHALSMARYRPYSSRSSQPTGASRLCLGCHDGTVPIDAFGGMSGDSYVTSRTAIGTDLTAHHPISFTYNAAMAASDPDLRNPQVSASGQGGTVAEDMLGGTGILECTSCHDVHNTASAEKLLRTTNAGGALCLICHDK